MNDWNFLIPYGSVPPDLDIKAKTLRKDQKLSVIYQCTGSVATLLLPKPKNTRLRIDRLWEKTCFEFFFGEANSAYYWEVNCSPTGDWNIYSFENYRRNQLVEKRIKDIHIEAEYEPQKYQLKITIDLSCLSLQKTALTLSPNVILEHQGYEKSYWALKHLSQKPDFHLRQAFLLNI